MFAKRKVHFDLYLSKASSGAQNLVVVKTSEFFYFKILGIVQDNQLHKL